MLPIKFKQAETRYRTIGKTKERERIAGGGSEQDSAIGKGKGE